VKTKGLISISHEIALKRDPPNWRGALYNKILVPLDKSSEAEDVLPMAQELLNPEGEGILLHVIPRCKSRESNNDPGSIQSREQVRRNKTMGYLLCARSYLVETMGRWRCEVVVADSVAEGIASFAMREGVDIVAMYTHDRKGIAKLIRKSIAEKVQKSGPVEVRVLRPRELVSR